MKLSYLIFSGTEQLSLTLQGKDITVQEGTMAAETTIEYLKRLRTDNTFSTFYSQVLEQSHDVIAPPTLTKYPRKPGEKGADGHAFSTPEDYFCKQYFEVLDLLINEQDRHFQQKRDLPLIAIMEKTLLDAANSKFSGDLEDLKICNGDIDLMRLKIQLQMLPDLIHTRNCKN